MSAQNPARSFGVVPPEQALKMSGIEFLSAMRTATASGQLFDGKNRRVAYGSESCLIMQA